MFTSKLALLAAPVVRRTLHQRASAVFMSTEAKPKFQYTTDEGTLTTEQRASFEENGYLVVKNNIDHDLIDELVGRFRAMCDGKVELKNMVLMRNVGLLKSDRKGEYLYEKAQDIAWDKVFEKYIMLDKLLNMVQNFVGVDIAVVHTMLINKPPDMGTLTSRHPLHQDLSYFSFRPANRIIGTWTALEKVTEENGCLCIIPGTHRANILHTHDYPEWDGGVNIAYHEVKGFEGLPRVLVEVEKGDTVFFHPLVVHGSGPNITKGFRKAMVCHYLTSQYHHIDITGTMQEKGISEVVQIINKKSGKNFNWKQIWDLRHRLVRGRPHVIT